MVYVELAAIRLGGLSATSAGEKVGELTTTITWSLASKLGSIAKHAEELLSDDGHIFDKHAMESALCDPEVQEWLKANAVMFPVKR